MNRIVRLSALTDARKGRTMFAFCFIFYFVLYLGRLNWNAALTEITRTGMMDKDVGGFVGTVFFVAYGAGQFVNGILSDKLSPFGLVGLSLGLSGGCNLLMYAVALGGMNPAAVMVVWGLNGYAQSAVWPTLIRIVSTVLPEDQRVSAGVNMLATTAVGTVLASLLSSAIMQALTWKEVFLIPGGILIAAALCWLFGTKPIAKLSLSYEVKLPKNSVELTKETPDGEGERSVFRLMLASGALFMLAPIVCFAIIKDGLMTWTPTMLAEIFDKPSYFTVRVSTFIPLISFFGAGLSKLVMEKWLHDELKSSAFMFSLASVSLILLITVGMHNMWLMLLFSSIIIMSMLGINTMYISLVPLRFAKFGKTATLTGVLNSAAAVASGVATWLAGRVSKSAGWTVTSIMWFAVGMIGLTLTLLIYPRWKKFTKNDRGSR